MSAQTTIAVGDPTRTYEITTRSGQVLRVPSHQVFTPATTRTFGLAHMPTKPRQDEREGMYEFHRRFGGQMRLVFAIDAAQVHTVRLLDDEAVPA